MVILCQSYLELQVDEEFNLFFLWKDHILAIDLYWCFPDIATVQVNEHLSAEIQEITSTLNHLLKLNE